MNKLAIMLLQGRAICVDRLNNASSEEEKKMLKRQIKRAEKMLKEQNVNVKGNMITF